MYLAVNNKFGNETQVGYIGFALKKMFLASHIAASIDR